MKKISILMILLLFLVTGCTKDNTKSFFLESYQLEFEDGKLFGTLTTPKGDKPVPIAILVPRAGAIDRDGNHISKKENSDSLKMVAEALANSGIASIRYDKRGVGSSSSLVTHESDLIFEDYIDDVVLWTEKIKSDERFDKYYIIGHGEGALVGAAAANKVDIDGFISIAGPGEAIDNKLIRLLKREDPEVLSNSIPIIQELKKGNMVSNPPVGLEYLFRQRAQPYLISLFQYEPKSIVKNIDAPILILQGDNDLQTTLEDASMLHGAVESRLVIIEGMNHVLKDAPRDIDYNMETYNNPSLPLNKELKDEIISFIR